MSAWQILDTVFVLFFFLRERKETCGVPTWYVCLICAQFQLLNHIIMCDESSYEGYVIGSHLSIVSVTFQQLNKTF
jgi:hypothetical protein